MKITEIDEINLNLMDGLLRSLQSKKWLLSKMIIALLQNNCYYGLKSWKDWWCICTIEQNFMKEKDYHRLLSLWSGNVCFFYQTIKCCFLTWAVHKILNYHSLITSIQYIPNTNRDLKKFYTDMKIFPNFIFNFKLHTELNILNQS